MSAEDSSSFLSREFLTVGLSSMLFFIGMGASSPLLPKFVVDELGGTDTTAGIVIASFAVSSLGLRIFFGRLGDRRGARRLMLIGVGFGAASMVVFSFTDSIAVAILGRMLLGGGQAAIMTGSTVLAIDLAPVERRGEAASYILVSFHLGLGIGPVIGESVLSATSYDVVWLTLAVMMVAGALVAATLPHRPGDPFAPPSPWIHPSGLVPGLVSAFGVVAFVSFSFFVPLYGREIGLDEVGPVFTVASISIVLVRVVFRRAPDVLGPIKASTFALLLTALGAVVLAGWNAVPGVYVAGALMAAGMALQTPALIQAAVRDVAPNERASAMATFTMFMDLSVVLTGPLLGWIASESGYRSTFLVGGGFSMVGIVIIFTMLAPQWRASQNAQAIASSASS
jgi:MFS family permease